MNLAQTFKQQLHKKWRLEPGAPVLLAVSGGLDSVVLTSLCVWYGLDVELAHANFRLRGAESDGDEAFVRELGKKYDIPVRVKQFDTSNYAIQKKISTQVAARELRYAWFEELMRERPAILMTAHHADDNVETILMNFFKGTGIAGLSGINEQQGKILRPLLDYKKEALLAYAQENKLGWREDSSNAEDKYTRNYFRHHVIPVIEKVIPGATTNLMDNVSRFREIEVLYQQSIEVHKKRLVEKKGGEWHIPVLKLKQSSPLTTIVWEISREFGFSAAQAGEIISLLDSESGKYIKSTTHRIIKNRKWLIIAPLQQSDDNPVYVEKGMDSVNFDNGRVTIMAKDVTSFKATADVHIACLDAKHLTFPLIIRKWKTGDYFYPLGMKKKKKLARFFIDQKLSRLQKEKVWVIESDKRICWVIGHRIDDRFKITPSTRQMMEIRQIID